MKKKLFIIIPIVLVILIISIILYKMNEVSVKVINKEVNINEEVYNLDYVKVKKGTIVTKRKKIDTSSIGIKKITIKVKNKLNKIKKYTFEIKVVDKEKPVITFNDNLTTTVGSEIDLLKNVTATDNSNEEIKVNVEGDYDFDKVGTYELYYVAKDSSDNETKEKFTLEVKEEVKKVDEKTTTSNEFTTSKGFKGYTKNGITYIDGILVANKTYSLPSTYNPGGLTSETNNAFNEMKADAASVGLNIYVVSGFRSYSTQDSLYNRYVARDGKAAADTYSARPGHSEHQTGLAFDLNDVSDNFENTEEAKWLNNNAYKYGFILRYPKGKTNETGYIYESWHFRYVGKDLASKLYNNGDWITLESYFGITSEY